MAEAHQAIKAVARRTGLNAHVIRIHELGAPLVGAAAANLGWHVTYLGAGRPRKSPVPPARIARAPWP